MFFDKTILMKKFLSFLALVSFISPVFAEENWGVQSPPSVKQGAEEASQKVWDREESEKIHEYYGSEESPGFLNREDIDPSTSEFEEKYDYEDDAPYNYEAGGS